MRLFYCMITHICIFQLLLYILSGETPCIIISGILFSIHDRQQSERRKFSFSTVWYYGPKNNPRNGSLKDTIVDVQDCSAPLRGLWVMNLGILTSKRSWMLFLIILRLLLFVRPLVPGVLAPEGVRWFLIDPRLDLKIIRR